MSFWSLYGDEAVTRRFHLGERRDQDLDTEVEASMEHGEDIYDDAVMGTDDQEQGFDNEFEGDFLYYDEWSDEEEDYFDGI